MSRLSSLSSSHTSPLPTPSRSSPKTDHYYYFSLFPLLVLDLPSFSHTRSSNSKPLSPGVIAAIATVVSVLFAISLFALYRSQQRKNRRRDLSRTQEIEARREAAATRTSSRGGSLKSSQGEEGTLKVERAGSCSSQGTMVEVDVGLGERVVVQELGRKKSGGSR